MTRAALVQGWNRAKSKRGMSALATLQPSGSLYTGDANGGNIGVAVEVYQGGYGWVDVTDFTQYRDGSAKLNISRGKPDEASRYQPQTASVMLNNRDSRFSPRNPTGPYYGLIGRNTPIRISRMHDGIRWYRYAGEVPEWPSNADISNTDVYTQINAYGQMRRLSQGNQPVPSAIKRGYLLDDSSTQSAPISYWPCEDSSASKSFASGLSKGGVLSFTGSPTISSNTDFKCSNALPVLNGSIWSAGVPSYVPYGVQVSPLPHSPANVLRFLASIPSGADTAGIMASMFTSGTVRRMDLQYYADGNLGVNGYDAQGNSLFTTGEVGFHINGVPSLVQFSMNWASSTSIEYRVAVYSVDASVGLVSITTLASSSVGQTTGVSINPNGTLKTTAIGHVAVQAVDDLGDLLNQIDANDSESPRFRFARLSRENGVNNAQISGTQNAYVFMGPQLPDTYLNLVQECVDAGLDLLYEAKDQNAFMYRTRNSLYNQGTVYNSSHPSVVLDYEQNQLSSQPVPKDDDFYTRNDVIVNQTGGSSSRATLDTGTVSTQLPPNGIGDISTTYPINVDLNPDDSIDEIAQSLADHAGWRLHMGTVDEPRFPAVTVNLRNAQFQNNPALLSQVLALDIGDVIQINNAPDWISVDPIRLIIQGYQESLGAFEHDITFNTSPESPYRTAVFDDWTLSRGDTDGSTLTNDIAAAGTKNIKFSTTNPLSVLWTTQPQDFPFDVNIGGERVTVVCPGNSKVSDPFISSGLTHYSGNNAALSLDVSRPFPTNADGVLDPFALQTILVTPVGGFVSVYVISDNSSPGSASAGTSYTAWAWVYSVSGHQYQAFINWADSGGGYLSTSLGTASAPTSGQWTLYTVTATAPASTSEISVGVNDSTGSPTTAQTLNVWGINAAPAADMTQSSPQNFTVVRSVNGVVKAQTAGTDVRLWQPMVVPL